MPLWLSWLNTSVNKQSQAYINLSTSIYQASNEYDNKSMQDINKVRDRERTIANTGDLFRGSSTLALRPRLQHYEGILLESILPDHLVSQHLQGVHTRTLGLTSPSLVPARTTHASTLAC